MKIFDCNLVVLLKQSVSNLCVQFSTLPLNGFSLRQNVKKTRKLLQRKGFHFHCSKFDTLQVFSWLTNIFMELF